MTIKLKSEKINFKQLSYYVKIATFLNIFGLNINFKFMR